MANKLKYHKLPILITMLITLIGNVIYFYLEATESLSFIPPKIWMLISRFVMGLGAGRNFEFRIFKGSSLKNISIVSLSI
jgi:hypothetical protein